MEIKYVTIGVFEDGAIRDGARAFSGATLSPDNYGCGILDISILHRMRRQAGRPPKEEEQFELRSEL